ncbi:unnamed protein product [Arabidopsis halleri]
MRHGATLAAGEVVLALHQCGYVLYKGTVEVLRSESKKKRIEFWHLVS